MPVLKFMKLMNLETDFSLKVMPCEAEVVKEGKDVTLIGWGNQVRRPTFYVDEDESMENKQNQILCNVFVFLFRI